MHLTPRLLTAHCRPELLAHFRALSTHDVYLRFGAHLSRESVDAYVTGIDFATATVLGVYGNELELLGVAHLAPDGRTVELGLSVVSAARRRGIGTLLMRRALGYARRLGATRMFTHCLAENEDLMRLVRSAGGHIVFSGDEADAYIELPASTAFSTVLDLAAEQVALVQYALMAQHTAWREAFHLGR
jgi:GNAT superfamily N-acetyltransferase